MRKVKLFLTPHIEIRIYVSEEMERDYAECQKMMKRGEDYDCDRCSWANVSIYGTGACELKRRKESSEPGSPDEEADRGIPGKREKSAEAPPGYEAA